MIMKEIMKYAFWNHEIGVITKILIIMLLLWKNYVMLLIKQKVKLLQLILKIKLIVISDINSGARKTDKHIYDSNKIKLTTFAEKWINKSFLKIFRQKIFLEKNLTII